MIYTIDINKKVWVVVISLGTLVPNSTDRQGKIWLPKKQKTAPKTTLQQHLLQIKAINHFLPSY